LVWCATSQASKRRCSVRMDAGMRRDANINDRAWIYIYKYIIIIIFFYYFYYYYSYYYHNILLVLYSYIYIFMYIIKTCCRMLPYFIVIYYCIHTYKCTIVHIILFGGLDFCQSIPIPMVNLTVDFSLDSFKLVAIAWHKLYHILYV
jgi:hypothetical protein